LKSHGDG